MKKALFIVVSVLLLFSLILILPYIGLVIYSLNMEQKSYLYEPEIKYGEFDFTIEYEILGEKYIIDDILICKFKEIRYEYNSGYHVDFETYIKSTGKEEIFLFQDFYNDKNLEIYLTIDSSSPFLNANSSYNTVEPAFIVYVDSKYRFKFDSSHYNNPDTRPSIVEKYQLKVNFFEYDSPIVNVYPNNSPI